LQFVYEQIFLFRNYRGGQNNTFDLKTFTQKLPWENSRDIDPVWMDNTIYFLSDRDFGMNIWAYDITTKNSSTENFLQRI
jgi:tricorn protease